MNHINYALAAEKSHKKVAMLMYIFVKNLYLNVIINDQM